MPLSEKAREQLRASYRRRKARSAQAPKRGAQIFERDYPRSWKEFIGQEMAREHLQAAVTSAKTRGVRLEHVLLRSGFHGIGKSSLARLIAGQMGAGLVELSGKIKVDEARLALESCEDGDVLFIDEVHQTAGVSGEWLLHLLQDGRLLTARGAEKVADVTVVAATTDAQRLAQTVLSRFPIRPTLAPYTDEEAVLIAKGLAKRLGFGRGGLPAAPDGDLKGIALAGNNSPRDIRALLVTYRDTREVAGGYDLARALRWMQLTEDGLDDLAQQYLQALVRQDGPASIATIRAVLHEPGPLHQTEQLLLTRGFIEISSVGRELTDAGEQRAHRLVLEEIGNE